MSAIGDDSQAALREVLARKYPEEGEAREFVERLGLVPARIAFHPRADLTWFSIVSEAKKQGGDTLGRLSAQAAADFPHDKVLRRLSEGAAVLFPDAAPTEWNAVEPAQFEKILGTRSSLVPVSFLESGMRCAQAVVRITCADGSMGTGFLIDRDRIVTNHHVIGSVEGANEALIEFNAQIDVYGRAAEVSTFRLSAAAHFSTSKADDLTAIAVDGQPSRRFRHLDLSPHTVAPNDRVNIIQHPGGGDKQLSYFHNVVTHVTSRRLQYLTDTMPGSSGSPIFDKDWNLVGVHHSVEWTQEAGLKHGTFYRNQGTTTAALRELIPDICST